MKLSISAYAFWVFSFVAAQRVQQPLQQETVSGKPVQVVIIGAGAAGSSAAYHLSQYAHNASLPINITIFESNSYIGGRSTTVTAYNLTTTELDSLTSPNTYSVELGASIFVAVNHILVSAVQTFNLSTSDDTPDNPKGHLGQELGIWDGDKFLLQLDSSFLNGYWSLAKLLFRYGLAPIRTHALTKSVISKFLKIYESPIFPFKSLTAAAQDAELLAVTAATGEQYLRENGISEGFAREVVQASTRVNYAQNLEYIHGLETMVCMATDGGARSVKGGNWRIFEEMVKASGASVNLEKRVSSVTETRDEKYRISLIDGDASEEQQRLQEEEDLDTAFDHVVVASPWQYANVEFGVFPEFPLPDKIPYVRLHVTLFTSPYLLDPEFFNVPKDQAVPQVILTTLPDGQPAQPGPEGVGRPGFFSISLLRPITNPRRGSEEYLYKIFSPGRVSDDYLAKILNSNDNSDDVGSEVPSSNEKVNVTWIYRKIWNSYPYETPRVAFEDVQLRRNVWYTGGMDNFISTMETNALMGKNVAKLIVDAEQSEAERRRGMQMDEDMKARKQDL